VNDSGQIVGALGLHAFSWTPLGGIIDLGTVGANSAVATAINANGEVVGNAVFDRAPSKGFFWTPKTGIIELATLLNPQSMANAINARGEVVGTISLFNPLDTDHDGA
jgi:probable HAF family extracellular repeat protein